MPESSSKEMVIMGAGAAGIAVAIASSELGWKIKLIDQHTAGSGATGNNPGRMGLGLHYSDLNTALMYLRASIKVQRTYPGYLIAEDKPYGRGRYYITKDSMVPKEKILQTYEALQAEYTALIAEDPLNQVFGLPGDFFRILEREEYSQYICQDNVDIAVECAEHLFDWPAFARDIRKIIEDDPNIELIEHTEIVDVTRGAVDEERFTLHLVQTKTDSLLGTVQHHFSLKTNYVANSTWANIEKINDLIGLRMVPGARTNRLKSLLKVKLPDSLREEHSAFFCMGPHCMFSNMGDGYGMMTFADVTNMEVSQALVLSESTDRILRGQATKEEMDKIADEILSGVSKYIPEMARAEIIEVKFGIVRTEGTASLDNLHSPFASIYKRDYKGVDATQQGWISNPAIKLFYFLENGELVAKLLETQYQIAPYIDACFEDVKRRAGAECIDLPIDVWKTLALNFDLYTPSKLSEEDLDRDFRRSSDSRTELGSVSISRVSPKYLNADDFFATLKMKLQLNREIVSADELASVYTETDRESVSKLDYPGHTYVQLDKNVKSDKIVSPKGTDRHPYFFSAGHDTDTDTESDELSDDENDKLPVAKYKTLYHFFAPISDFVSRNKAVRLMATPVDDLFYGNGT